MESIQKETTVLGIVVSCTGIIIIIFSYVFYYGYLGGFGYEIPHLIGVIAGSLFIAIGVVVSALAGTGKWTMKPKTLKECRNGFLIYGIIGVVLSIVTVLIYSAFSDSASLRGMIILPIIYDYENCGFAVFNLWRYYYKKNQLTISE